MKKCLISIEFNINYWASPWIFIVIKYILLININNWYFSHVFGSKLPSYSRCCTINHDVIISIAQPWRHHWNVISCERHVVDVWQSSSLSWFLGSSCRVGNIIMYLMSWRTALVLIGVLFGCLLQSTPTHSSYDRINNSPLQPVHYSLYIFLAHYSVSRVCRHKSA